MTTAKQRQSQHEALVESGPDAIVVVDPDGRIVLVNAQTERLFGYDRSELLGEPVEMLIPTRFRGSHVGHRRHYLADPRPRPMGVGLDLWARRRDGSEVPIDVSLSSVAGEEALLVTAFVRDVTDRRAAEAAFRESEQRFALMVSNVADHAILMLDPAGKVLTWNETAQRINGYSADEIVGRHLSVFYSPEDIAAARPDRNLAEASEHGSARDEGWRLRKDGSRFWAEISITALWDDDGQLRGFGKVTRDATERHESQARLEAVSDITRAVLEGDSSDDVLHLTADRARRLVGGSAVWVVLPDADTSSLVVRAHEPVTADLIGLSVPIDSSLAGEAMRTGEPIRVPDLSGDERAPAVIRDRGFGAALFVPLSGQGRRLGVLVVARDRFAPEFTGAQVALVSLFAAQAAVALAFGEARVELERMGTVEDRERIARNLHDTVIQRLFATGMALEGTVPLVERSEVRTRLGRAVEDLDETIRAIRTTIFELETRSQARPGLRRQILDVVSDAAANLGFDPTVRFEGPVDTAVPEEVAAQLLPTLREALSNAVRHAGATRLDVSLVSADEIALRVADDGVGLPMSRTSTGKGLRNMRERAEALGGALDLATSPGGGTALTWCVPNMGRSAQA